MKKLNELLGTEFPIIQGGMANIATGEFAAACSNAGALGVIATGGMLEADLLRQQIRICKSLTDKPFGVNLMLMNPCADEMAQIIIEEGVQVVTTGAGSPGKYIPAWKEAGIKVLPVVAASILAKRLVNQGPTPSSPRAWSPAAMWGNDHHGAGAAGHRHGGRPRHRRRRHCRRTAGGSGLRAGGLRHSGGHLPADKPRVPHPRKLQAGPSEGQGQRHHRDGPLHRRAGAGAENKMAREYLALEKRGATLEELEHVTLGGLRRAVFEGDMERGSVMAGQVAGMLHEIKPLRQIFEELYTGSQAVLKATEAAWQ